MRLNRSPPLTGRAFLFYPQEAVMIGLIPARGGSKGIPLKALYPLNGKPLILYTIEAALQSKLTEVVVTTDCQQIADYCRKYARVIMRPPELAQDDTPMVPVVQHAMKELGNPEAIMLLQPTSPLRTAKDINNALCFAENVVSVYEGIHPKKSYDDEGKPFWEQIPYDKHKDKCYTRNGAIFITSRAMIEEGKIFGDSPVLYIMSKSRSVDIDDFEDLRMAEAILRGENQ